MREDVLRQIAELEDMSMEELKVKWRSSFGTAPPRYNRPFIVKRLAYRIQELAYGGLAESTLTKMEVLLTEVGCDGLGRLPQKKNGVLLEPVTGTRFVRHWRGEDHEVITLDDGYQYRGRKYKSLSAIAREITGTRWNGPVFFGVKNLNNARKKDQAEGDS